MKHKLTKAEYEALTPEMKLLYVADGEGYKLPLLDYEDPAELRRAKDREVQESKDAKAKLAAAQAELDKLKTGTARQTGDIAVLEKSWNDKYVARETELNGQIAELRKFSEKTLIDQAAATVAGAITAKPENADLMKPHIINRFEVVWDGNTASVKVKDAAGRLSAMNFEELQKELVADKKFATVVVVSKASGAGGSGGTNNGGAGGAGGDKKFAEMTGAERTALYQSDRASFERLAAEDKQAQNQTKFAPRKPLNFVAS